MNGDALAATDVASRSVVVALTLMRSGFDVRVWPRYLPHGGNVRGHFGDLGDDGGVHVADRRMSFPQQRHHLSQQNPAVVARTRAAIGKVAADVAKPAAPSNASHSACSNTSPSEWATSPRACGMRTPPG